MTSSEKDEAASGLDPVAAVILETLAALPADKSIGLMDAARAVAETRRKPGDGAELWRRYMRAVRQQAIHLARQGRIEIIRKGAPVDPNDVKGVVRLRLKGPAAQSSVRPIGRT